MPTCIASDSCLQTTWNTHHQGNGKCLYHIIFIMFFFLLAKFMRVSLTIRPDDMHNNRLSMLLRETHLKLSDKICVCSLYNITCWMCVHMDLVRRREMRCYHHHHRRRRHIFLIICIYIPWMKFGLSIKKRE